MNWIKRMFHLCEWTNWSNPVDNHAGTKNQYRRCKTCNRVGFRKMRWDSQVDSTLIVKALNETEVVK